MSRVVVISGHPNLETSYTNSLILQRLEQGLADVEVRRLDRLYPDYQIDVQAEQEALKAADLTILQFPFYWYSMPALLKKWLDDTFSYNFAYGAAGDKLKGKDLLLSVTVGGPKEAYSALGYNHFRVDELLKPLEQTAYLAGLNFRTPVVTHSMTYIPGVYNTQQAVEARAEEHAVRLLSEVEQLLGAPEQRIQRFVTQWFAQFDRLPSDASYFQGHLAEDAQLHMPEGTFTGHAGFNEWYAQARATFKPDCQHQIEQLEVSAAGEQFRVQLRIRLLAETFVESAFNGAALNLLVNETWQVTLDSAGQVRIHSYQVTPVNTEEHAA